MALESYCAACTWLKENADKYGRYWCPRKGQYMYACDPKCSKFLEERNRGTSARKNMYDNSSSNKYGSHCYLTTAMCHILGYPDDNYYLQMLRTFRDTTLKTNPTYIPLLLTYDIVGPQIATKLENDEHKDVIAESLLTRYITPAINAIENNKTSDAVNIYVAMTQSLAERYDINLSILNINAKDIDLNAIDMHSLGHARTRKKTYQKPTINVVES